MAVSLDTTSTANGSSVSSLTFSHTVGAGSNTLLVVAVGGRNSSTASNTPAASVTFNGVSLTKSVEKQETGDGNTASVWYLVAPASGAHNIVVTYNGTCTSVGAGGVSLFGVDQVTPVNANASFGGSTFGGGSSAVGLTALAGSWAIDSYSGSNTWSSWGGSQIDNFHSTAQGSSRLEGTTAGANSLTVTFSGFAQGAYTATAFRAAAGGGGFTAKFRKTLSTVGTGVGKRQAF